MSNLAVPDKLIRAINILEETTRRQAEASLNGTELTALQRQAAILTEQLRLVTGPVDYANTRLKGTLLAKLEAGDLWQAHPSSPASLDELIMEAGISKSEKSDLLAWERVIYPYLERELDLKPWQVWQMLNKTKRRRLTPYLREIIDPEHETTSDKVKGTIEKLRDEAGDVPDKDLAVVERLLDLAQNMTSRDMEEEISAEPTPPIEMDGTRHKIVTIDGETGEIVEEKVMFKLVAWVTQDQLTLLQRRFPDRLSLMLEEGDDIRNTASGKKPQI